MQEAPPKVPSDLSDTEEEEPSPKKKSKNARSQKTQQETVKNYPPLRGRSSKSKQASESPSKSSTSSSKSSVSSSKNSTSKASKTSSSKKVTPAKEVAKVTRKLYRDTSSNKGSTEKNSSKKKTVLSARTQNVPKRAVRNLSSTKELSSDIENEIGSSGDISPVKKTSKKSNRTALKVKSPSNKKTVDTKTSKVDKSVLRTHQTKMDLFLKQKKNSSSLKVTSSPLKEYPRRMRSPTKRFSPSKHHMRMESDGDADSEDEMDEDERPPIQE